MAKKEKIDREDWINHIAEILVENYLEDCEQVEKEMPMNLVPEFIEHLLDCLDSVEPYLYNPSPETWKPYKDKELAFLKKHGQLLKTYRDLNMYLYYGDPNVLVEKGIFSPEKWNNLKPEQQSPSQEDFLNFTRIAREKLESERDFWMLMQKPIAERTAVQETINTLQGQPEKLSRGKIKRGPSDTFTSLSQEQTVLLLYYLQRERAFLKDEYLTAQDAGHAFELLTGYSQNTIRQNIGKFHLYLTPDNLKELDRLLTRVRAAIAADLK